jgi:hypothetical protein
LLRLGFWAFCIVEIETAIVFGPFELDSGLSGRETRAIIKRFSRIARQQKTCTASMTQVTVRP